MTDVDECERSPDLATASNVNGTQHVAATCEDVGSRLLFFSTGFVFDAGGDTVHENDPRSPANHYAATKVEAEDAVRNAAVESVICRIDQPFCWPAPWQSDPFVSWTLDRLDGGDPFPVFEDWHNTPVYVPDCNDVVLDLLETGADGTYHVVGPDYLSRYEWARDVASAFGYDPGLIERGHSDDVDLPASRPNNHLRNDAVERETGREIRSISAALEAIAEHSPHAN